MCGICGFNWEDKRLLDQMISGLLHRGPDAKGKFFDKSVSLGNTRLSIIDISKKGNQPIFNKDNSALIIHNGELYNYKTLREELSNKGHSFNSETDTEVILHAYEEYGIDCLSKFNGIFAFCIYDLANKKLFLARDPVGVKPLYYHNAGGEFIFASEIKSILKYQEIEPVLNLGALSAYFSFRYVPGPQTMFKGIMKLLPGHYIIYDIKKRRIFLSQYYDIQSSQKTNNKNKRNFVAQLEKQLRDSINAQIIGDVPSGLFLSGGLDSSSVLAFMKQADYTDNIHTFSLGFENQEGYENELKYARFISEYFGTNHDELITSQDSLKILPKLVFQIDEPVSDATIIPTYLLSERASKKVKFVLTGEGGDELFGGYVHYGIINKLNTIKKFLPPKSLTSRAISVMPSNMLTKMFDYPSIIGDEGRQRLVELTLDLEDKVKTYLNLVSVFSEHDKKRLVNKNFHTQPSKNFLADLKKKYFQSNESLLTQVRSREMQTWLPDYILTRLDKMSMACSLESRVPLLDKNLLIFANSLPCKYWLNKTLFKSAMRSYLPKKTLNRRKYPFTVPIDQWYGKGYKEIAESILDEAKEVYQFVNKRYVDKLLSKKRNSNMIHSRQLWSILTLSLWYKIFIEKTKLDSFR